MKVEYKDVNKRETQMLSKGDALNRLLSLELGAESFFANIMVSVGGAQISYLYCGKEGYFVRVDGENTLKMKRRKTTLFNIFKKHNVNRVIVSVK